MTYYKKSTTSMYALYEKNNEWLESASVTNDVLNDKSKFQAEFTEAIGDYLYSPLEVKTTYPENPNTNTIDSVLKQRGNVYGDFKDGAKIMRALKKTMHDTDGWEDLTSDKKEALDMIQHKIARILNGDPEYKDNWVDIAGYSKLVADEL